MDTQVAEYLKSKKDEISELYTWAFEATIPYQQSGITIEGTSCLERTISLKSRLRDYIAENPDSKDKVAEAQDWRQQQSERS